MNQLTDEEIMKLVAKGDLEKLTILFDRYNVRIFNYFNKMIQNKMVSEDLTQDVFVKVVKYRTSYKNGKFASWIFTVARNIFSTYYQNLKKERFNDIDDENIVANIDLVTESNQDNLDHMQKAILQLSNSDRELIVMHRFQEINYQQIAEIIGSNENAVKVKAHRALKKLKDIYFKTIAD